MSAAGSWDMEAKVLAPPRLHRARNLWGGRCMSTVSPTGNAQRETTLASDTLGLSLFFDQCLSRMQYVSPLALSTGGNMEPWVGDRPYSLFRPCRPDRMSAMGMGLGCC